MVLAPAAGKNRETGRNLEGRYGVSTKYTEVLRRAQPTATTTALLVGVEGPPGNGGHPVQRIRPHHWQLLQS